MRNLKVYPKRDCTEVIASSCLVSGNARFVKTLLTNQFVKKSLDNGRTTLYLDFSNGRSYLTESKLSAPEIKELNIDDISYDPFYRCDAKKALRLILQKAKSEHYAPEIYSQAIKYILLLERMDISIKDVRELNERFQDVNDIPKKMMECRMNSNMTDKQFHDLMIAFQRSVKGNILIADILAQLDFYLTNNENNRFSIKMMDSGIYRIYCNSVYEETTKLFLEGVLNELCTMTSNAIDIIINAEKTVLTNEIIKLVEMLTTNRYNVLFVADDIYSQYAEANINQFRNYFDYNVFAQHNGESAEKISKLCGTQRIYEHHFNKERNKRLFSEKTLDIIFKRDYSEGIMEVPAEVPNVHSNYIQNFPEYQALVIHAKQGFQNYRVVDFSNF